jgi:hypothetical protein
MLQHMTEAQIFNLIVARVNLIIRVLEVALNHERARVARLARACVVRAGVAALCLDVRDVAVLGDDLLDEGRQAGVDVVGDDADGLGLAGGDGLVLWMTVSPGLTR